MNRYVQPRSSKGSKASVCSVCEQSQASAGSLQCKHQFCHDCFARYIDGTLDELHRFLRCCICGENSVLTTETKREPILLRFGRDVNPKLRAPIGLSALQTGEYVTADPVNKRIYLFDNIGRLCNDFAYVHNTTPMLGITVTLDDLIVVPLKDSSYRQLAYYRPQGTFVGACYLEKNVEITALATNSNNDIIICDSNNKCVHFIHERRRLYKTVKLEPAPGEKQTPVPQGVAINSKDHIIITDSANHCIRVLDENGKFLFKFGSEGARPCQFVKPSGLTIDKYDRIIVADEGNHRVQIINHEGEFLRYIVRYNQGRDVYMAPVSMVPLGMDLVAVMLRGVRDADAAEVRVYFTPGVTEVGENWGDDYYHGY